MVNETQHHYSARKALRVVFAGTPDFACTALESLLASRHEVIAVLTQPDKPAGRGLKVRAPEVKILAQQYRLPIYQPTSLKDTTVIEVLQQLKPDVIVVAAYGLLIPANILSLPRLGCVNIHPSLLPRWRGAAPIQRTIFAGDSITGVTIMQMDLGLDTGPILLQQRYVMDPDETSQTLHDALAKLGASALVTALDLLAEDKLPPQPQNNEETTYAQKISKEEALIDWREPAIEIEHTIRAFNPWPVAYTSWRGQHLRVWHAKAIAEPHQATPRTLIRASREGIDIATGDGLLRLLSVQLPGGKVLSVNDFYNAKHHELTIGEHFI